MHVYQESGNVGTRHQYTEGEPSRKLPCKLCRIATSAESADAAVESRASSNLTFDMLSLLYLDCCAPFRNQRRAAVLKISVATKLNLDSQKLKPSRSFDGVPYAHTNQILCRHQLLFSSVVRRPRLKNARSKICVRRLVIADRKRGAMLRS